VSSSALGSSGHFSALVVAHWLILGALSFQGSRRLVPLLNLVVKSSALGSLAALRALFRDGDG